MGHAGTFWYTAPSSGTQVRYKRRAKLPSSISSCLYFLLLLRQPFHLYLLRIMNFGFIIALLLTTALAAEMPKPHVLTEDELSGASSISVEDAAVAVADIADKSANEDIVAVLNTTEPASANGEEPQLDAPAFLCETKEGWIAIEEIDKCIVVLPPKQANSSTPRP